MMSLLRRQFNLAGIIDPGYRFGQSGVRDLSGMHNYLGPDSGEFYLLWRQPCRLHLKILQATRLPPQIHFRQARWPLSSSPAVRTKRCSRHR
jgi:hypothetical protein